MLLFYGEKIGNRLKFPQELNTEMQKTQFFKKSFEQISESMQKRLIVACQTKGFDCGL
jgi:hypothetical protein